MKLRVPLSLAILAPVVVTILGVVGLAMFLSASSNMASVERALQGGQEEMIGVLTEQFAGSVRFGKMEAVEAAFKAYQADPDFGLAAAGAVDATGAPILQFGIGVGINGEHMPASRWAGFALVWAAVVVFSYDSLRVRRAQRARAV